MNRRLRFMLAYPLCFVATLGSGQENLPPADGYQRVARELSEVINLQLQEKNIPCLSIALVDEQRIVWAAGFGLADRQSNRPATAQTIYRVGSLSKLFTGLAIMQAVEQKRIDLDRPVQAYLADFRPQNPYHKSITLRQLTSHRSGLVREPPVGHYFDPTEPSLADTVESLNLTTLVYEPETRTKYSNAGVSVVGYVLQRATGEEFERAINQSILRVAEMNSSSFDLNETTRAKLASAVMWTQDGREFPAPTFKLGTAPAGNLYATVRDLGKFAVVLINDGRSGTQQLLQRESLSEMMSPQFGQNERDFGIGFHLSDFGGHKMVGHGGAVYGFSTQLQILPQQKLAVVCAAAKDVCNGTVRRLADHALRCLLSKKTGADWPQFETTDPIPPARARLLDGLYENPQDGSVRELVERNGRLFLSGGEFRRELKAQEDTLVADDPFGIGPRVEVVSPETLKISGKEYVRAARTLPDQMPQRWNGLVGEYGWDHNTLFIYERHGQLWCLIEWFFHYPLTEIDEDTFQFPDYGLYHGERLVFQRTGETEARQASAAGITFVRRNVGVAAGETFKIKPVKPIEELRTLAVESEPPERLVDGTTRPDLVELVKLDPSIQLDIRYSTKNNFMGAALYTQPRAFMQRDAAEALVRAHRNLRQWGYGLWIFDAYRPWYVTKMFWDATPAEQKIFVANPAAGSRHNRGCAVDLTLYDLTTGRPVWMGAGYDEFSPRSFPDYQVVDSRAGWHRELLRDALEAEGFTIYEFEWWHFDYHSWQDYPVMNIRFEEIP